MERLNVAVLISGRGSNLEALLTACAEPDFPARVVLVVSDKADAAGLARAEKFGVPNAVVERRDYGDKPAFEAALMETVRRSGADTVCLAGFMRLLGAEFLACWGDRILNIHPSLLPSFRGLNTHERALAAGVRISGCTVHIVRPAMDEGPILVQAAVPVMPDDAADDLANRVLAAEHQAYPHALRLIAEKRVRIENDRAVLVDSSIGAAPTDGSMLIAPSPADL